MGGHRESLLAVRLLVLAALCWGQARGMAMTLEDLDKLAELFAGQFDNNIQHMEEMAQGGGTVHTFVHVFHVPIEVLALRVTGRNGHLVSRQFYVELYVYDNVIPVVQQIVNFVLKRHHIAKETYDHPNPDANVTVKLEWRKWADDRLIFENLRVEDLVHNPSCDKLWTKAADEFFIGTLNNKNCTVMYGSTEVYEVSTTNLTASMMVEDPRYLNVNDDTLVAGSNLTPFVYDRIDDIPPMPAPGAGSTLSTCDMVSMVMCLAIEVAISDF